MSDQRDDTARAVGWDLVEASHGRDASGHARDDRGGALARRTETSDASLSARILSVFAEPGVESLDAHEASSTLHVPLLDAETALEALAQAGHLQRLHLPQSEGSSGRDFVQPRFAVPAAQKAELERMFHAAAQRLGETRALAPREEDLDDLLDDDEPRLPITAGILSLFLPGTGQLLNGDIGRASLIFAVWALAMLTPFSAIVTFVRLYAGAEAFFNAKIRRLERQQALREAEKSKMAALPQPRTEP